MRGQVGMPAIALLSQKGNFHIPAVRKPSGTNVSEVVPLPSRQKRRMISSGKLTKRLRVPRVTDLLALVGWFAEVRRRCT